MISESNEIPDAKQKAMKYILHTDRLALREFSENDAGFIIELVNTEEWRRYIGDKNIKTTKQAKDYLNNGPIKSYAEHGYGLCLVERNGDRAPIGMCGIINRPTLNHPDIGFAFLPGFLNQGFGYEIASATLQYAKHILKLDTVLAITVPDNSASIRLLEKLGFSFQNEIKSPDDTELMLLNISMDQ